MNKKEIAKKMNERFNDQSFYEVNNMIDVLIETIINGVNENNKVSLSGFAIFEKILKPASSGEINGNKWKKDEHYSVKIKPLKRFKDEVNKKLKK